MKKYPFIMLTVIAAIAFAFNACNKQSPLKALTPSLPAQPYDYVSGLQNDVIAQGGNNSPQTNPVTNAGAALGRVLFYDPRLSVTNSVSCGSCHKQQYAFADNVPLSTGYAGMKGTRNALAIINASTKASFFWDGRASTLEEQTLMPVVNHVEMGMEKLDALALKLNQISYYPQLFQSAFGSSEITPQEISGALAQFVRSIVSDNSKFDANQAAFTADELAGFQLFFGKFQCGTCHKGENLGGAPLMDSYFNQAVPASSVKNISNIGLDLKYADGGVGVLLNNVKMDGDFVIPSLRNVALTAPYMHDGRFATLDEVVDHYSNGILPNPNLDPILLQQNFFSNPSLPAEPVQMKMTAQEKRQLIAFLNTLTDYTMLTDDKYSNPFK